MTLLHLHILSAQHAIRTTNNTPETWNLELIPMPQTYHIPGRFHPYYSLLGRGMDRWIDDERRAESLFIVLVVMGATGLVLLQFLIMAAFEFPAEGPPTWLWAGQLGLAAVFLGVSVVDDQPEIIIC